MKGGTPNYGLYGLYYPKRGVMKRQEFHYLTNMKGYREFCHFVLYYDQKVLLRILWRCKKVEQIFLFCGLFMRKCIYSSLKRERQSSKLGL